MEVPSEVTIVLKVTPSEGCLATFSLSTRTQGGNDQGWLRLRVGALAPGQVLTVPRGSGLGSKETTCRLTPSSPMLLSCVTTSRCFHHLHGCPFTETM